MNKRARSRANMHTTVTLLLDEYDDVLAADADLTAAEQVRQGAHRGGADSIAQGDGTDSAQHAGERGSEARFHR